MTTQTESVDTKRNVFLLIVCQALLFVNNTTMIAVNGLVAMRWHRPPRWPPFR